MSSGDVSVDEIERNLGKAVRLMVMEVIAAEMRDAAAREPSVVYLVQAVTGGPVKIGLARDAKKRLSGMQTHSATELRVVLTLRGDHMLEKALHARFADWRIRGEWFDETCPEIAALLAALKPFAHESNGRAARLCGERSTAATTGGYTDDERDPDD